MAMPQSKDLIPGDLLLARLGIDIAELSYLIMKYRLTVFEELPKKFWLRYFVKSKYRRTELEELLEIVQNDPEKLDSKLFLRSEIENLFQRKSSYTADLAAAETANSESDKVDLELESKPSDFYNGKDAHPSLDNKFLLRQTIEHNETQIKQNPNVFCLLGGVWFIKFKNEEWGLYPDHEKYRYIAYLLNLTSETTGSGKVEYAIHILGLLARVKGDELPPDNDVKPDDGDLSHMDLSKEITKEEIGRIGEIGNQLLDQLQEARKSQNQDRIYKVQDIIARYRSHLLKEYGIKTRVSDDEKRITFKGLHRSSEEIEKVRQLIKNQMSNAIREVSKNMPLFATHLQHSLRTTDYKAVYSPEHPLPWTVSTY